MQPYPVGTRLLCDGSGAIWEVTGWEHVPTWGDWMLTLWSDGRRGLTYVDEVRALVISPADYATLLAERDRARDIAARLEGEIAQVRDVVTAWSLGETGRDEMVLWAIREIVGLTPARPETPTPWPHPDAEVAP